MRYRTLAGTCLRGTAIGFAAIAFSVAAVAQDAEDQKVRKEDGRQEPAETLDGQEVGTVDIGESVRSVQTGTATPVTVIGRNEILDRQANTVAELIDSIPSVSLVNGSTPVGSAISIRGFGFNPPFGTDNKVSVQIDGAAVDAEEIYRLGNQVFTEPDLFKTVEVIRGTVGSFEYGSGIIGGVVRLETIDAFDLTGGEAGIAASQTLGWFSNGNGLQSSSTIALAPSDRVEFLGNFTWRQQNNQTDGNGNEIGNGEFELPSFLLKAGVFLDPDKEHYLRASYQQTSTADRDVPLDTFITATDIFGNVDRDTLSQVAILRYNYNPLDNEAIDITAQFSYTNQTIDQTFIRGSSTSGPAFDSVVQGLGDADLQFEIYQATLKNAARFGTWGIRHTLRTGFEFRSRVRADANSAPGGVDNRMAFFAVDEILLARGLTVTPAIRYETQDVDARPSLDNGTAFSSGRSALMGGVSARYEFPVGLAFFGSWAQSDNFPILDDLENLVLRNRFEVSETHEFGGSFDRVGLFSANDRLAIKANYFNTEIDNLASTAGVAAVETEGFEVEASYATQNGFYIDFNASIISGEETRTNGTVFDWRNLPQNTYVGSVGKRFDDLLDLRWESILTEDRVQNGTVDGEGYDIHNLRAILTPRGAFLEGFAIRASVENLFDSFYQPARALRPAPGRNFKVTLAKQF